MQLKILNKGANRSQIFPKTVELEATELIDHSENSCLLEQESEKVKGELDVQDTKTNKIYLMDFSSDRKWISYVSQCELEPNKLAAFLSLRKFTAINDESLRVQEPATIFDDDTSILHEMRIQIDANPLPQLKSMPIDKYFNSPGHKFLSISPNGQYITLSTYDENKGNKDGLCFIFKVQKNEILFHQKLQWNGRAVFLNSNNGLRLAIINTAILIIYNEVGDFSKIGKHEIYDLTSFGSSREDFKGSSQQYLYTEFTNNWSVTKNPSNELKEMIPSLRHIIALSTYIEYHILISPFTGGSRIIRLWSLFNNGDRLASLTSSNEAIVAISKDLRYAATASTQTKNSYEVKVYNLVNGNLLYTLQSLIPISKMTHATFCSSSRYLAVSAIEKIYENSKAGNLSKNIAIFEVWYIEEERSIYSIKKSLGHNMKSTFGYSQEKTVKPFISEEMVDNNDRALKGYYVYADSEGKTVTRCFELKFGNQQQDENSWLLTEEVNFGHEEAEFDLFSENSSVDTSHTKSSADSPLADCPCFINNGKNRLLTEQQQDSLEGHMDVSLDKFLCEDTSVHVYSRYEIIDGLCEYEHLKCRFINWKDHRYLLRCGKHMVQVWKLGVRSLANDGQCHQLVYIKPYTNSLYRSFYLTPNIWRLESFKSIRYFNGLQQKIMLDIVEDDNYLTEVKRKKKLTRCTEEIILPLSCDKNTFNYRLFEGACQTLYYLNICIIEDSKNYDGIIQEDLKLQKELNKRSQKIENLLQQTKNLLEMEIEKIDKRCRSFTTIAGSKTLALLASFERGRDILRLLLKNEDLTFSVSSYSVSCDYGISTINHTETRRYYINHSREQKNSRDPKKINYRTLSSNIDQEKLMPENVLAILIRERSYNLYHLMLNRIILDSEKFNPECLLLLKEVVLLLLEMKDSDQLEKTSQKLSCVPVNTGYLQVLLPSEWPHMISDKADVQVSEGFVANVGNMKIFSAMERIPQLEPQSLDKNISNSIKNGFISAALKTCNNITSFYYNFKDSYTKPPNHFMTCVVPLPYFNTYYETTVREAFLAQTNIASVKKSNSENPVSERKSEFLQLALNQHSEPNIWKQGDDMIVLLLQYKWAAFVRFRFYCILSIHIVYYLTYCVGIQFAFEVFNYDIKNAERSIFTNTNHLICTILFFITTTAILLIEINQIPKNSKLWDYLKYWYNYVDILAIVFPSINFLQLTLGLQYFYELCSVSALILWLHGIIRLRVFSSFGIALEIIIQLFKKVISVFLILLLVIFGFTHSFIVLLRQQPDQYFQENYGGDISFSSPGSDTKGENSLYDLSSSNGFSDPFKALYQVWLFIFGVWDPVTSGDAGDSRMLFVLCMLFAFITVLIFTNMIIALMSSTVEEVKRSGKKAWMTHFAAVIAEIEDLSFFTSKSTRYDRANNPAFIFYSVNHEKVKRQQDALRQDTIELRKILLLDEDEQLKSIYEMKSAMRRDLGILTNLQLDLNRNNYERMLILQEELYRKLDELKPKDSS